MDNSLEEMKYELEKAMRRECKLDFRLAEVCLLYELCKVSFLNFRIMGSAFSAISFCNSII